MKRWIRRIFLILLILLLAYAAVVLAILYTDFPRVLILNTLNKKFGLQATIDSMNITFGGKTTIQNISLSLPMEDAPVLMIPQLDITHTKIPLLLFRGFELKQARVENPLVNIRQDQTGTWNLQRLAYYFQQNLSGKKQKNLSLPVLEIINGMAVVTDNNGISEKISPIVFDGKSSKQHVWDFQGDIASQIILNGKIAQSGDMSHEVNIEVNDLPKSIKNLVESVPESLRINANWKGNIREGLLSGRLQIAKEEDFQVDGTIKIEKSSDGLSVDIDELLLSGLYKSFERINIPGGKLKFDGKHIQAQRVFIEADSNKAVISGNWNIEERRGDFDCSVTGTMKEKEIEYVNTLSGMLSWPANGKKQIELSVNTRVNLPSGSWQSNAEFNGEGETVLNSKWHVAVPSLAWNSGKYDIQIQDIKTEISADWPEIKFDNFVFGNARESNAQGMFSADTNNWNLSFDAKSLHVIEDQNFPVDLKLIALGDMQNISIEELSVSYENMLLECNGKMSLLTKELSDTKLTASMELNPDDRNQGKLSDISGKLKCETEITGTVLPVKLHSESVFAADNIKVNKQDIKPLEIKWQADFDSNVVIYNAEQFNLFDGTWSLDGRYDIKHSSAQVTLDTEQVSLRPVIQLFNLPIECKGILKAALDVTLPVNDINQMVISGNWNVRDMAIPPIEAKNAEGRIKIENGTAQFDKIRLLQGHGIAQADAWFRLNEPEFVYVDVESQEWPISFSEKNMILTANANGFATLNLAKRTMKGKGTLAADVVVDQKKLAYLSADVVVEERLLDFNDMTIEALGGRAKGDISIPLGDWTNSKASLDWEGMSLEELAVYYPRLESLKGKSSGSLTVKKAESKRAFEPLKIDIYGKNENSSFRNTNLGDYKISAYLGRERLLIDEAQIETMNGQIKSYGNVSRHAGNYSVYLNTDFSQIETNQLLHTFLPDAKPVIGKLSGKGMLVIFSDLKRMTGDANIQITESDFAQTKIIGTLYNTMKLKFGKSKPSGSGRVKLRFEGSSLHIPSFEYFNRGVEIRGGGSISDLTMGKSSPVKGYAFGSARPLKGINLLGIGELDKLMTSLQKRAASVQISGTLEDYEVEVVPFKEISRSLRVLLWDQLRK